MTTSTYPVQLGLNDDTRIARGRPLVQWLLAIPQLAITSVLTSLRHLLIAISLVTVVFTKRIPRQIFDAIAMTHRYEWRATSYALFLHERYPPFDFQPSADDDAEMPQPAPCCQHPHGNLGSKHARADAPDGPRVASGRVALPARDT